MKIIKVSPEVAKAAKTWTDRIEYAETMMTTGAAMKRKATDILWNHLKHEYPETFDYESVTYEFNDCEIICMTADDNAAERMEKYKKRSEELTKLAQEELKNILSKDKEKDESTF